MNIVLADGGTVSLLQVLWGLFDFPLHMSIIILMIGGSILLLWYAAKKAGLDN